MDTLPKAEATQDTNFGRGQEISTTGEKGIPNGGTNCAGRVNNLV